MVTSSEVVAEILVARRVIPAEALESALVTQDEKGGDLTEILVQQKAVTEEELLQALAAELEMPFAEGLRQIGQIAKWASDMAHCEIYSESHTTHSPRSQQQVGTLQFPATESIPDEPVAHHEDGQHDHAHANGDFAAQIHGFINLSV